MNKLLPFLLVLCTLSVSAQENDLPSAYSKPMYISVSSGVDNIVGIGGVTVEKRFTPEMAVEGGVGRSLWWGEKICLGGKLYFTRGANPWAVTTGMTLNTGLKNVDMSYNTHAGYIYSHTDLLPLVAWYAAVVKHWRVAPGIRIFVMLGASVDFSAEKYSNPNFDPYKSRAPQAVTLFTTPGGPMLATGLSFRVNRRADGK